MPVCEQTDSNQVCFSSCCTVCLLIFFSRQMAGCSMPMYGIERNAEGNVNIKNTYFKQFKCEWQDCENQIYIEICKIHDTP